MNDAAQIRRCSGALRTNELLFRPSPDGPRKARSQTPATGCRKRTRTQRVQPSVRPSFLRTTSARRPIVKTSNRESLRLEIAVTQTKERIGTSSNREKEACFSDRVRAVNRLSSRGAGSSRFRVGGGFWFRRKGEKLTADRANPVPQREGGEPPPLQRQNGQVNLGAEKNEFATPGFCCD